jgi:hypothetical protein
MPTPTIPDGELFMNATLYTGNGGTQTITNGAAGQSFQPDFVWLKSRSGAGNSSLTDSVRGVNSQLFSNLTDAQGSQTDQVTALNSNGFSLGANVAGTGSTNVNTVTYVGWQWKAGGAAVTNTAGTISSQVSANTTSGFSVVTYTGTGSNATVGHGLGVAPSMVIVKCRSNAISAPAWPVWHTTIPASNYLDLQTTIASSTASSVWNSTLPTSSVFSIGTTSSCNSSGFTYVAYCWAQIAGYSAFGSYTGNGSTDGPFVYLGFRPRFIMLKVASGGTGNWEIFDTSRNTYNQADLLLLPSSSNAESAAYGSYYVDFLSNGFKIRGSGAGFNGSGEGMIYACWAENPFKYSNAR